MDQHIDGLTGVVSIADDIVVIGGNEEHRDRKFSNLMKHERRGLGVQQQETPYDVKPDPDNVRDMRNMPSPQSKGCTDIPRTSHISNSINRTAR